MKKVMYLFLISIIGSLIINSCSESTTPTVTKEYFPGKTGDTWIYERSYKENGADKTAQDSTIISSSTTVKGKVAFKYDTFINSVYLESYYRYSNDSKLYALPSELLPKEIMALIPAAILPQDWVVVADDKSSNWEMFRFKVEDLPIDVSGVTAKLNGDIIVTGQKAATMNFTVAGKIYSAQEFNTKISYVGKIFYGGYTFDFNFEVNTKSYFADKVGLIRSETPKQEIKINNPFGDPVSLYTIEASSRMLTRFSVQ
ncbi:MAG: hypothetical protein RO257_07040 [Candidatus Kapabacteria bacterium]|nr:hypothetical protein [Candidatus Kapabacteria bacterium]